MKKLLILILIPFCFAIGEQNWKWLNPLPQGRTINQIKAIDSLTAYAAADNGVFLKTTDGGINWILTTTEFTAQNLTSLFFADKNKGWLTGENGLILYTTDGGASFTRQITNITNNLYGIAQKNSRLFAAGNNGTLLVSTDNGSSWSKKNLSVQESFTSIRINQAGHIFISGSNGTILKSTDDGENWISTNTSTTKIITDISFANNEGWACGQSGTVLYSSDNGTAWQNKATTTTKWLTSVSVNTSGNGVVSGKDGVFIVITGRSNFQLFKQDSTYSLNSVSILDNGKGWLAGTFGLLNKTTDAGLSWEFQSSGDRVDLNKIKFITQEIGFVTGNKGFLLKTTDSGNSWYRVNTGTTVDLFDICYYNFAIISRDELFMAGGRGTILKSFDKGETWTIMDFSHLTLDAFTSIATSRYRLIAGGPRGKFLQLNQTTGNANLYNSGNSIVNSFYMLRSYTGFGVGDKSGFYYINMPLVYKEGSPPFISTISTTVTFSDLNDITFYKINGWAVGKYGVVLTCKNNVDQRTPWKKQIVDITEANGVNFADSATGFICGSNGTILKTTDAGATWNKIESYLTSTLNKINFRNSQTGFVIGSNGLFIRTDNGGGPDIVTSSAESENIKPSDYVLEQNYPNPFNPSTQISFTLPKGENVTLKVYDLLGKEVLTLANEYRSKGKHTVIFEAEGLSSGIYIYTISAGSYYQSRKMLLLK